MHSGKLKHATSKVEYHSLSVPVIFYNFHNVVQLLRNQHLKTTASWWDQKLVSGTVTDFDGKWKCLLKVCIY